MEDQDFPIRALAVGNGTCLAPVPQPLDGPTAPIWPEPKLPHTDRLFFRWDEIEARNPQDTL